MATSSERTYFLKPSSTSRETLYTCPNKHTSKVNTLILTNSYGSSIVMLVEYYDASTTTYYTLFDKSVATKDSVLLYSGGSIAVLESGDKLIVTAATADSITAIATVHELLDSARN